MKNFSFTSVIKTALTVLTLSTSVTAFGQDETWYHVNPLQSNDVTVLLDFQLKKSSSYNAMYTGIPELWVNIRRPDLKPDDKVHVMLINYKVNSLRYGGPNYNVVSEMDLSYAEDGRFTGAFKAVDLYREHFNSDVGYIRDSAERQEIAVWINDQLYKDPLSQNNLSFDLKSFYPHSRGR